MEEGKTKEKLRVALIGMRAKNWLSIIKDAEVFLEPVSDVILDRFLAFVNFFDTDDGDKADVVRAGVIPDHVLIQWRR